MALRVLYLSQWFPPENGAVGLQVAHALRARGHEVEALTGFPNYPSGKLADGYRLAPYRREVMEGVTVHRVWLHPSHDRSSLGRALNYVSFFASALIFLLAKGRRFDVVYVYHPPIMPALAAALSGFVTRKPFVVEVQDLWPDSVATAGMTGASIMARVLGPICRFVYRRAALVLGQSRGMAERLIERGAPADRTDVIFNWADEQAARRNGLYDVASLDFEGSFNFVYAGNLGIVQALEVLIEATQIAACQNPRIRLTLIGEGTERRRLEALARERGLTCVRVLPGVPADQIGDVLAEADVQVVHLKDDPLFEITIPSKTQFYLAMGRPILIGVRGEAARIVTAAGAGVAVTPQDVPAIAEAMVQMAALPSAQLDAMGASGRAVYETDFSFAAAGDRLSANVARAGAAR